MTDHALTLAIRELMAERELSEAEMLAALLNAVEAFIDSGEISFDDMLWGCRFTAEMQAMFRE